MKFDLAFHHFYAFVPKSAPAVDEMVRAGFVEGSKNRHQGQGTANRRLFFENGMLEFIWLEDLDEIRSAPTAPSRLWERSQYQSSGYAPFGIGLCPVHAAGGCAMPFVGWSYRPVYLPPGLEIWQAANDRWPSEPGIFYLPFAKPYTVQSELSEPRLHDNGVNTIERVLVTIAPSSGQSDAAIKLQSLPIVSISAGRVPSAIVLLNGPKAMQVDLSPWCPVMIEVRP